jgi:hypothetical protein
MITLSESVGDSFLQWGELPTTGLVRLFLGKIFARWVYKNTNARDDTTMRCFFGLVRLFLGNIFARWVYKDTNARDDTTMRCFFGLVRSEHGIFDFISFMRTRNPVF